MPGFSCTDTSVCFDCRRPFAKLLLLQRLKVPRSIVCSRSFCVAFSDYSSWATCMAKRLPVFGSVLIVFHHVHRDVDNKGRSPRQFEVHGCLCCGCRSMVFSRRRRLCVSGRLATIVLLIAHRHHWETVVVLWNDGARGAAVLHICSCGSLYPLIGGVEPGGKQEMLGALYQQTIITVLRGEDNDVIREEEERSAIDGVLIFDLAALFLSRYPRGQR